MWILCYPKCSTCRKAVNWLAERGVEATYRNIQAQNPSYEELRAWVERSGLPVRKFFNTSGLQYRALGLKDKLPQMGEEEQLRLLSTDGMLVKRPLLIGKTSWPSAFSRSNGAPCWPVRGASCAGVAPQLPRKPLPMISLELVMAMKALGSMERTKVRRAWAWMRLTAVSTTWRSSWL